jgi:amino acid transporter
LQVYLISITLIGLLVPWNDPRLLNGSTSEDAKASPFVIAITNAGIKGIPSVFNVVIMIAVLSVGNSSIYGSSRTLAALAVQHQAPQMLGYIDRKGRPLVAIVLSSAVGLIAYTAVMSPTAEGNVFNWLLALSGLSSIFTWLTICLCHIRFRGAWKLGGHTLEQLPFKSQPGLIGSWLGLLLNLLVFVAQFWTGFSPEGYASMTTVELVINFFEVYLAAPIILISYVVYKIWFRTSWVKLSEIDVKTGMREDLDELAELKKVEMEKVEAKPWWKIMYYALC